MPKNAIGDVAVKVQAKSGFDKSFKNILTTKVGTLTPLVSKLLIPNSDFSMSLAISAALPPLASDTFMRCDLKVEAFAVPLRLVYGGFESWFTGAPLYQSNGTQVRAELPRLSFTNAAANAPRFAPGTLFDYLGYSIDFSKLSVDASTDKHFANLLKPLCYHRIYHDWYRNRKIQKGVFSAPVTGSELATDDFYLRTLPFRSFDTVHDFLPTNYFWDGFEIWQLRQRNFADDYFTVATSSAQDGNAQKVTIDSNDQFTIAALRSANSLQQFSERNNLASPQMQDYCRVNYGAKLSSGVAQRSVLLGSASFPVYTKGVEANSANAATTNPFTTVGARYGQAYAVGSEFVVKGHVDEPCYLMVLVSLVPEANYGNHVSSDMIKFTQPGSIVDFPNPQLENIGNEPIYSCEASGDVSVTNIGTVFGYVPRYTSHKTSVNEVHGLLRYGQSLQAFVSQRVFSNAPSIVTSFLRIPTDFLDDVTAVSQDISEYGCWIDSSIRLMVSEPLSESALPSLQDPNYEHGKTEVIQRNGSRL